MIVETKKRVTIKDVAKASGMSFATVSRVLNSNPGFPEKTRKKVWDAANQLNYTPNSQARGLRAGSGSGKREKTGIIIHITHLGSESPVGNEFEAQRSLMLGWEAEKQGMFPISYWYYKRKGFQCPPVLNGHIDGAIVGTPHIEVVEILKDKIPMVLMDVPFSPQAAHVPVVNLDFRRGFSELMIKFKEHGHKQIGLVHSTYNGDATSTEGPVISAITGAAELNDMEISPDCYIEENLTPDNHDDVMKKVTARFAEMIRAGKLSAIVLPNMSCAVSLSKNLTEAGFKIPEDVSIAGLYSGLELPPYGITAVRYDWNGLIETSLEVLKSLIDRKSLPCKEFLVAPIFYEGSTIGIC